MKAIGWGILGAQSVMAVLVACSSDTSATKSPDGGTMGSTDASGGTDAAPADADAADAGLGTGTDTDAADGPTDRSAAGDAGGPVVVATLGGTPLGLALAADTLYVTVSQTAAGHDGKVVSVGKTAVSATIDAGTVATLASGLNAPKAIAPSGSEVYWADVQTVFPGAANVLGVPTAGGSATEILSSGTTLTRLVIVNSVLYTIEGNGTTIAAYSLTGTDAGALQTVYPGNPPNGVIGPDSDGTSVFFFANGATNFDLYSVPAAGGAATDLAMNVTSGSVDFDFLVDDATTIYWSDSATGNVNSLPKMGAPGTTPKLLTTFSSGSAGVQLVLDGDNVYALSFYQLARFPKAGGTPVILASVSGGGSERYLASQGANASALAVDNAFVYWLYAGHGEILKIAK